MSSKRDAPPNQRLLLGLGAVLGLVVVGSLGHVAWTWSSLRSLQRAPAVIVDVEHRTPTTGGSQPQRVPVAEVTIGDGAPARMSLESSSNSPFCCDVGEQLDVYYDPSAPERSLRADRISELYGVQLVFAAVGALFLLALRKAYVGP